MKCQGQLSFSFLLASLKISPLTLIECQVINYFWEQKEKIIIFFRNIECAAITEFTNRCFQGQL